MSVIIKEGRVVFQIGYTKDNILEIRSSNRYPTGNWTHLEASRYYDRKKKIEKGKAHKYSMKRGIALIYGGCSLWINFKILYLR